MHTEIILQSLGLGESCDECKKEIRRGGNINMVVYEDGKPYGRIDDECLKLLKRHKTKNKGE